MRAITVSVNDLAKRAAEAVDADYVVELAQKLVRIRSVYEPDKGNTEAKAAQFIAQVFRDLGLEPTQEDAAPNRPNVIADWQGSRFDPTKHKTLMFEGHTDVVTEGSAEDWSQPPFAGHIEDGNLYGRGSADMKGGIAAAIGALAALKEIAPDLPGRIRMGIVADEEGMMLGIKHFIEQGWADEVSGAIICEPEENELCLFQKGALRVAVTFTGVMSHGAMPYAGVNPIKAMSTFIERVGELETREQTRLGEHKYLGLPWFTPTITRAPAEGEAQLNVMPAQAYLTLDIRTVPGQHHDEIVGALETFAKNIEVSTPKLSIEVDAFESRPWTETPQDDPLVRALENAYPLVFDEQASYGGVPGATDGTFLKSWADIPIVTVGPGDRTIPHQRDEFVRTADMVASARLYAAAAIYFLSEK